MVDIRMGDNSNILFTYITNFKNKIKKTTPIMTNLVTNICNTEQTNHSTKKKKTVQKKENRRASRKYNQQEI